MIIGVQGVPLNYIIREYETPNFDATVPYQEAIIQSVALTGSYFNIDTRTVHQNVLHNVHADSDDYTYIKNSCATATGVETPFHSETGTPVIPREKLSLIRISLLWRALVTRMNIFSLLRNSVLKYRINMMNLKTMGAL